MTNVMPHLTAGLFSLSVTRCMKQVVKCAVRHRTLPEEILNLFWQDSRLALHFSLHSMGMVDDAILLCFTFPGHLGSMVLGARGASVELWTLLKSLKCDCIKIIRRNQEHIHILIIMQSGKEEGRKYEILWKAASTGPNTRGVWSGSTLCQPEGIMNIPAALV